MLYNYIKPVFHLNKPIYVIKKQLIDAVAVTGLDLRKVYGNIAKILHIAFRQFQISRY